MQGHIEEKYLIRYEGKQIGVYYFIKGEGFEYRAWGVDEENKEALAKLGLAKDKERKRPIPLFTELMREENRVPGTRKEIWKSGDLSAEREPKDAGKFWIYRRQAEKGEEGYSEKDYSAPHWEGPHTPEGMREWASWYCFNKKDNGMYEAELDEAWWWGGGHNDGGTIRREVPEEWLSLPYDEFLERVVGLSAAAHYGFTAEELKEKKGLKEFFGF